MVLVLSRSHSTQLVSYRRMMSDISKINERLLDSTCETQATRLLSVKNAAKYRQRSRICKTFCYKAHFSEPGIHICAFGWPERENLRFRKKYCAFGSGDKLIWRDHVPGTRSGSDVKSTKNHSPDFIHQTFMTLDYNHQSSLHTCYCASQIHLLPSIPLRLHLCVDSHLFALI